VEPGLVTFYSLRVTAVSRIRCCGSGCAESATYGTCGGEDSGAKEDEGRRFRSGGGDATVAVRVVDGKA